MVTGTVLSAMAFRIFVCACYNVTPFKQKKLQWLFSVKNHISEDEPDIPQKTTYAHIAIGNRLGKTNGFWRLKIGLKERMDLKGFKSRLKVVIITKGTVIWTEKTSHWAGYKYIRADQHHAHISSNNPVLSEALRKPLRWRVLHLLGRGFKSQDP